jgi:predicted ATPase
MITNMQMVNFKSWRDTGELKLAPLTGFFGTNSSGKSSLLQMLLLLKQTMESNDRNLVLNTGTLPPSYINLGTAQELTSHGAHEVTLRVGWNYPNVKILIVDHKRKLPPLHGTGQFETVIDTSGSPFVQRLSYDVGYQKVAMQRESENEYRAQVISNGQTIETKTIKPIKYYGLPNDLLTQHQDYNLADLILALEIQFEDVYYLGPLRDYPQRNYIWGGELPTDVGIRGERATHALITAKNGIIPTSREYDLEIVTIVQQWLEKMGLAHSLNVSELNKQTYELRLQHTATSPEVLITDVGFGVSQVLPVLVQCYYAPRGSTLIFEQPEIHLHPSVQAALADVFIDVIQRREVQIILESHSEHLLRRLQRRISEGALEANQAALYFCAQQDGFSQITPLALDEFGHISNWPRGFFGDLLDEVMAITQNRIKRGVQP